MRKTTAAVLTASALLLSPVAASASETEEPEVTTTTVDDNEDDGMNWGWLGLLGLAGLAGLAGRKRQEVHTVDHTRRDYDVDRTRTTTTDVNRDGRTDHRDVQDRVDRDGDGRIG